MAEPAGLRLGANTHKNAYVKCTSWQPCMSYPLLPGVSHNNAALRFSDALDHMAEAAGCLRVQTSDNSTRPILCCPVALLFVLLMLL